MSTKISKLISDNSYLKIEVAKKKLYKYYDKKNNELGWFLGILN